MSIKESMLELLSDPSSSGELVEAAADTIATNSRFNGWVAQTAKAQMSDDEMMSLLEFYERIIEECEHAVNDYRRSVLRKSAVTLDQQNVAETALIRQLRSIRESLHNKSRMS